MLNNEDLKERGRKISLALKGRKLSEEHKNKIKEGCIGINKDKVLSVELKEKLLRANLGSKHSEEHKRKISESGRGLKRSEETKNNISAALKGKPRPSTMGSNNPNWKGGRDNLRQVEMGRVQYVTWRNSIYIRDNYTCQICRKRGGEMHAHHIKRWVDCVELRHDLSNGLTLCKSCHKYVHKKLEYLGC